MPLPKCGDLYHGRAGCFWNALCCPLFGTLGLLWRSFVIYVIPCSTVLWQRLMVGCLWRKCLCCFGWPYEDDSFYGPSALGDDVETDWVRAEELDGFRGKRPQLFEGDIEPSDLCQGAVGDCWLVAAMACASEYPDMVRHLFLTKEYNPRGLYKVRIYDAQRTKWTVVKVDDRIPCKKGKRKPRFMKPNGAELWAILLEKAYAKFAGSYAAIDGGFVLWGWHSMTGDNVFQLSVSPDSNKWIREDMKALPDKKDKRACGFRETKEHYSFSQVWTLLKKYAAQKSLLSASIGKMEYRESDGPAGEQMLEREGLVAGHAYSIIRAVEVTERGPGGIPQPGGHTYKLLQLRNPWGTYEWKGSWSDHSSKWKKHPSIAKQVGFSEAADDGAFWMEFKDFSKVYTRINVCDRDTAQDASLDVNEDYGSCGICRGFTVGCLKFWCLCHGLRNLYCSHETTDETLDTKEKCCFIC